MVHASNQIKHIKEGLHFAAHCGRVARVNGVRVVMTKGFADGYGDKDADAQGAAVALEELRAGLEAVDEEPGWVICSPDQERAEYVDNGHCLLITGPRLWWAIRTGTVRAPVVTFCLPSEY